MPFIPLISLGALVLGALGRAVYLKFKKKK